MLRDRDGVVPRAEEDPRAPDDDPRQRRAGLRLRLPLPGVLRAPRARRRDLRRPALDVSPADPGECAHLGCGADPTRPGDPGALRTHGRDLWARALPSLRGGHRRRAGLRAWNEPRSRHPGDVGSTAPAGAHAAGGGGPARLRPEPGSLERLPSAEPRAVHQHRLLLRAGRPGPGRRARAGSRGDAARPQRLLPGLLDPLRLGPGPPPPWASSASSPTTSPRPRRSCSRPSSASSASIGWRDSACC